MISIFIIIWHNMNITLYMTTFLKKIIKFLNKMDGQMLKKNTKIKFLWELMK